MYGVLCVYINNVYEKYNFPTPLPPYIYTHKHTHTHTPLHMHTNTPPHTQTHTRIPPFIHIPPHKHKHTQGACGCCHAPLICSPAARFSSPNNRPSHAMGCCTTLCCSEENTNCTYIATCAVDWVLPRGVGGVGGWEGRVSITAAMHLYY